MIHQLSIRKFWLITLIVLPSVILGGQVVGQILLPRWALVKMRRGLLRPPETCTPPFPGKWLLIMPLALGASGAAEELIFRWLPGLISQGWFMGITAALVFAAVHSIPLGQWVPRNVPLPQLLMGLWLWLGFVRFGVMTAAWAHGAYNIELSALAVVAELARRWLVVRRRRMARYRQRPRYRALQDVVTRSAGRRGARL